MRPDNSSTNVNSPDPKRRERPLVGAAAEGKRDASDGPRPLLSSGGNWIGLETLIRREITRFSWRSSPSPMRDPKETWRSCTKRNSWRRARP